MLLVNQNNVVDAKSVNASLIALKKQADKLNRQIATLEKSIKSLDGSKVDEKDLSNYYTKGEVYNKNETYNKTEVYNTSEITSNYYNKQSVDGKLTDKVKLTNYNLISDLGLSPSTASIADVVKKMAYNSVGLFALAGSNSADLMPTGFTNGSLLITKAGSNDNRVHIRFVPNGDVENTEYLGVYHSTAGFSGYKKLATEGDLVSYTNPVFYKTTNVTSDANGAFVGSIGGVSLNKIISLQVSNNSTLRIAKDANYARLYKLDGTFAVNTLIAVDIIYKP